MVCFSLGPTSLELSELSGLACLFPSPDWGSFLSLLFQISVNVLLLLFFFSSWHTYDSDVGTFKITPEVPKPFLIFLNSCFFILFQLNVYLSLLFWIVDLSSGFLPFTVGSLYIFLYSLFIAFTFCSILWPCSIISVSILITSVLNSVLIGCLSLHRLVLFLEFWSVLSFGPYFFVSAPPLHCKGWSLGYLPGHSNPLHCVVVMYVGEGWEREQYHLLSPGPTFQHFPCFPQADCALSGADSQVDGFVYILGPCGPLQQTLLWDWELLPLLQPPQSFYSQGVWVFSFPHWNLGSTVCLAPQVCFPVYWCRNVGPTHPPAAVLSPPLAPAAPLCSSYQSGWMFL